MDRLSRKYLWLTVVADVVCMVGAVWAAYTTRASIGPPLLAPLRHLPAVYLRALPWIVAILLLAGLYSGLYRVPARDVAAQTSALIRANLLGILLLAGASFLSHFDYSRAMLGMFGLYLTAFELGARALIATAVQNAAKRRRPVRALIVGTGELANLVADKLALSPLPGYECLGYVSTDGRQGGDVVGRLSDLPALCRQLEVEEVFVAAPGVPAGELMETIDQCKDLGVRFYLIAGPLQVLAGAAALSDLSQLPVIELPLTIRPSRAYLLAKRAMDVVVSLLLIIALAPLMLVIAWLVRRQSGGSAIFVQERVGEGGRTFNMYKFRTMYADVDPYAPAPTSSEDERITPIGRWLRRYSLDELPQLFNVLKGEMSLVGPRPEMPFIVEKYKPWQRRRLEAKPGITGLWQIMGRKDLPLAENIEYDFYYLRHQSLLLDIEILIRTIPAVLSGRGAY